MQKVVPALSAGMVDSMLTNISFVVLLSCEAKMNSFNFFACKLIQLLRCDYFIVI